ncbi:MAG: hypothetical protein QXL14_00485 [Candidatus Aenigmatarchaeota archaeon]
MCYTSLIFAINNNHVGELGLKILVNQIDENYENNNDGYALFFTNYKNIKEKIRTLHFNEFIKFIKKHEDKIKQSKLIHLHLRKSTNFVSQEFIHLWEVNNYNCSHNGILFNTFNNNIKNDSLSFFMQYSNILNNLNKLKNVLQNNLVGYGLFLLSNNNKFEIIAFSLNKNTCINVFNDNLVTICSNDFNVKNNISFNVKKHEKEKFLNFYLDEYEQINFNFTKSKIYKKLNTTESNFILYYNLEKNIYKTIKLNIKNNSYNFDRRDNDNYRLWRWYKC